MVKLFQHKYAKILKITKTFYIANNIRYTVNGKEEFV